jgi:hypothetical protein
VCMGQVSRVTGHDYTSRNGCARCSAIFADVSNPALGVGYELLAP